MKNKRIWEIDYLRFIAVILMIIFHLIYDLNEFMGIDINYRNVFWYWEGKIAAFLFILLAGISSGFSRNNFARGIKILGIAIIITIVTYIVFEYRYVRFGILHLLGVCMILSPMLKRINNYLLVTLLLVILFVTSIFNNILIETSLLIPLGIEYIGFYTVDYYPIFPYLAIFILGIILYKSYYYKNKSIFNFNYDNMFITKVSKRSLAIYILHQPLIIGIILLINLFIR